MIISFTISGDIPSKKNSKRIVYHGHRPAIISSKNYEAWHMMASYELKRVIWPLPKPNLPFRKVKVVELVFWPKTKRRKDLTNVADSVMDLLVDNGILADDNWFVAPRVELSFGGVDPTYPHVEIRIKM